ncbi:MAG: cytochrome c1 [Holosporales bacterium]
MKKSFLFSAILLFTPLMGNAAGEVAKPQAMDWSSKSVFGTYDRAALQRGFQVYMEVCASCHSLKSLSYRDLKGLGFSEAKIKAIAASVQVEGEKNEEGIPVERPGKPADRFKNPYKTNEAARAANNGALPPDLSLMAKARKFGADYLHALLVGYQNPPEGMKLSPGLYYNIAFPGNQIAMAPPLVEGQVTYSDGTQATVDQMSLDVATFLQWAADPHMESRKQLGIKVILYLLVFSVLMYFGMRRVWRGVKD